MTKLEESSLERWMEYAVDQEGLGETDWHLFRKWIRKRYLLARRIRGHNLALQCSPWNRAIHPEQPSGPPKVSTPYFSSSVGCRSPQGLVSSIRGHKLKVAAKRCGKCPICNIPHTYIRQMKGQGVDWPSERLSACPAFMGMSPEKRMETLHNLGGCCRCLSWRHGPEGRCRGRPEPCKAKVPQGWRCWQAHHAALHVDPGED